MTGALGLAGLFEHLHQGCGEGSCGREGAMGDDGVGTILERRGHGGP